MTEREEIITLIDEDGEQFDFVLVDYFRLDDVEYAVLYPLREPVEKESEYFGEEEGEEGEAIIFRIIQGEDGETTFRVIDDEEEWQKVAEIACDRLLSGEEEEEN